jgi:hypothetical protein
VYLALVQDAGFLAYYHLTGEEPVDLTTIRERLMPGTTEVRILCPRCALAVQGCMGLWPEQRRAGVQGWGTIYYKSTTDMLQDVRKVWTGYRSSYDPSDPVV